MDKLGTVVPVGHVCGHDMYVAWLIGAATLLATLNPLRRAKTSLFWDQPDVPSVY
jgi:metal-dependent amidase/aminoacylase/carboxypeptidase family protein